MTAFPYLYTAVIKKIPMAPEYKILPPSAVIAVCIQESKGVPTFNEKDELYALNLDAAAKGTKLPPSLLRDAMKIKQGPLTGAVAKFRFEPSYWEWSGKHGLSSPTERFLCSCSIGIGQQMMRWVLPADEKEWLPFIENFKGNVDTQLSFCIKEMHRLMVATKGDLFRAYKGYNSGNIDSKNADVVRRALRVVNLASIVDKQLKG